MKTIYRHKAITESGETFEKFSSKKDIETWIDIQIQERGLNWRAAYLIRFRDGLQLDFVKMNGSPIKL